MPRAGFWRTLWNNYCDLTHFHGFKEMQISNSRLDRCFWLIAIFVGFGCSSWLMYKALTDFLKDPVVTLVTESVSEDDYHLPFLYCPQKWIDPSKLSKFDATKIELWYAMSYLKDKCYVPHRYYDDQSERFNYGRWVIGSGVNLEWITRVLVHYVRQNLPSSTQKFRLRALEALQFLESHQRELPEDADAEKIDENFLQWMLQEYIRGNEGDVATAFYKYFLLDEVTAIYGYGERKDFDANIYNEEFFLRMKSRCLTLEMLDQMHQKLKYARFFQSRGLPVPFDMINDTHCQQVVDFRTKLRDTYQANLTSTQLWAEYVLYNLFLRNRRVFGYDDFSFRNYYANRLAQVIVEEYGIPSSKRVFRTLAEHLAQSRNISDLINHLIKAEKRFVEEEEERFRGFLERNDFETPSDFLISVSVGFEAVEMWTSKRLLEYTNVNLSMTKFLTGTGVCFQMNITRTLRNELLTLARLSDYRMSDPSAFNVVFMTKRAYEDDNDHFASSSYANNVRNVVAFGGSIYNRVPVLENWLDGNEEKDMYNAKGNSIFSFNDEDLGPADLSKHNPIEHVKYYNFKIGMKEIRWRVNARIPCYSPECNFINCSYIKYTYQNCRLTCDEYYTQPRFARLYGNDVLTSDNDTERKLLYNVSCYFDMGRIPLELMPPSVPDIPGLQPCSYFVLARTLRQNIDNGVSPMDVTESNLSFRYRDRDNCLRSCIRPCFSEDVVVTMSSQMEAWFNILHKRSPSNDTIIILPNGTAVRLDRGPAWNHKSLLSVMRFEVSTTKGTLYEDKFQQTWDQLFGVVGGIIGLIMGASCLTIIQLTWVVAHTIWEFITRERGIIQSYEVALGGRRSKRKKIRKLFQRNDLNMDSNVEIKLIKSVDS